MDMDYKLLLWCIYGGILIAALYIGYQKSVVGRLVRALIEKGCDSPENALTLEQLGLEKHARIRAALKPKSTLSHMISAVFPSTFDDTKNTFDFSATRFYLSDEKKEKAARYCSEGSFLLTLLFAVLGGLIIVLLGYILVPYLSTLFTELLS